MLVACEKEESRNKRVKAAWNKENKAIRPSHKRRAKSTAVALAVALLLCRGHLRSVSAHL